jgi:hypothetical protein
MPEPLDYQTQGEPPGPRAGWLPTLIFIGIVLFLIAMFLSGPLGD